MTDHQIVVPIDCDGERADKVVAVVLEVSRTVARRAIDAEGVILDGRPIGAKEKLKAGTRLEVELREESTVLVPDETVSFEVVHEDQDLLVVDKPAGVVVHPSSPRSSGTLVHGLLDRYPSIRGVGQEGRWGIVHRLDRDTSGLLVVARTHDSYAALTDMMRQRLVTRRYLALVHGLIENTLGTIEAPIGRDPSNSMRMALDRDGRDARTHYRRLVQWSGPDLAYLSVTLDTGRTHQIRVHMQAIDHPIVGDRAYGRPGSIADPRRPWLHARQLTFTHPATGSEIDITAPLPRDLVDSLGVLGAPDGGDDLEIEGMA